MFTGLETIKTLILVRHIVIETSIFREDVDHGEAMSFAYFIIVKIVGGGDLDTPCAKFWINRVIGNNGNEAFGQGKLSLLSNQMFKSRIFRVHSCRRIPQQGFWTGSCHHNKLIV